MLWAFDERVFNLLYLEHAGVLRSIALAFSLVGGGWGIFIVVPFLASARTRRVAAWLIGTLLLAGVVVFALKAVVGRDRPFHVFVGLKALALDSPTDHSFPSGHAAGSFAFALFVARVALERRVRHARAIALVAVAFASCVAVSRVVLGFHFPLDVLAGEVTGGTLGAIGARLYLRARARTHTPDLIDAGELSESGGQTAPRIP
jgi:undecaprenyl-diphosphatase